MNLDGLIKKVEVSLKNKQLVIALNYISEIRNKFRSTMFHNTVGVCEEEQNRLIDEYSKLIGKVETDDEESDVEIVDYNSVKIPININGYDCTDNGC